MTWDLDTQQVEIIGRHWFSGEVARAGQAQKLDSRISV